MEKSKIEIGQVRYCKTAEDHYTIINIQGDSATICWHTYKVQLNFIPLNYILDDCYIRTVSKLELLLY